MSPGPRKLALTLHLASSIGWFGAVAVFLAFAIAGLISADADLVRAAYLLMNLTTWSVIIPLALVSLGSGIVSSLGTRWGLFRYYWVVLKLAITLLSTIVLLLHTAPIAQLSSIAAKTALFDNNLSRLRLQMLVASAAALGVLLLLTVISVYKPQGLTRYGWRKQREERSVAVDAG